MNMRHLLLMQKYNAQERFTTAFFYLCIDKIYRTMTLQQMEYIVALDKYRHFVLAAEACGVTQPTLSAMIQKLEEELDVKIFSRDRKNITPTSIGEKIIRQAKIALNETQKIKEVVADESSNMNGNLRIGILPTIAPYLVPDFIYYFRKSYPNVNLFIDEKENRSLIQDLRFGNLDIAITTPPRSSRQHSGNSGVCRKVCRLLFGNMQQGTANDCERQSSSGTDVDSERRSLYSQWRHQFMRKQGHRQSYL